MSSVYEPALATYQREFWDEHEYEDVDQEPIAMESSKRGKTFWVVLGLLVVVGLVGGAMLNGKTSRVVGGKNAVVAVKEMVASQPNPKNVNVAKNVSPPVCANGLYLASGKCNPCPVGYYCKANKKTICPAGQYQPKASQAACLVVPCGSFSPAPGATTVEQCRAGTFSKAGSARCTPVAKGEKSGAGACAPVKCPTGQYQDCEGQSNCQPGPCGHYVSGVGSITFKACAAGTYQPANGKSSCIDTLPGEYAGVGHCKPRKCIPGQYQNLAKQASCKLADCGKHVPGSGANNQVACGKGTYQPDRGQASCLPIPAGYISNNNGCGIVCCPAGTYRDGNFKCVKAPCGSYVPNKCASKALKCPDGHYTSGSGASVCLKAPPGSIPKADKCGTTKCGAGTYQDQAGQTTCKDAKCGEIAPAPGMSKPEKCAAGTFQSKTRQTKCDPCPAGRATNAVGQCSCPQCAAGTFQPKSGQTSCINSPCGHSVANPGATKADPCPPGEYQDKAAQKACVKAPPGKYAVGGKCAPSTCPPGTFTPSPGLTKCTDAPCGTFVGASGQTGATQCPAGKYQPLPGQTKCLDAPTGSYTSGTGKCSETMCAAGSFQPLKGQQGCKPAACGHYVAITGSASQSPCGAGRYQPDVGKTSCLQADIGHFVAGNTACKQDRCPTGSYTDCKGQSGCIPASCGNFVTGTGKKVMTPCPAGTYQDTPGQGSCKTNPAGTFSKAGFCHAQLCDPGQFQNSAGQTSCKAASCGNFVDGEGRKSESQCPAGTYQPQTGQVGCLRTSHGNAPNPGTCQKGTVANGIFYGGPSRMTWSNAKAWCVSNGDRLAIVRSGSEQKAVVNVCKDGSKVCWIGGSDLAQEGKWVWVDGKPLAGSYQAWSPGEPNGGRSENCLMTWNSGTGWNDGGCGGTHLFVCERRLARASLGINFAGISSLAGAKDCLSGKLHQLTASAKPSPFTFNAKGGFVTMNGKGYGTFAGTQDLYPNVGAPAPSLTAYVKFSIGSGITTADWVSLAGKMKSFYERTWVLWLHMTADRKKATLLFQSVLGNGVGWGAQISNFPVSLNVAMTMTGVYDGKALKLYVNGVLKAEAAVNRPITVFKADISLGGRGIVHSSFVGNMYEFGYFNYAMTAAQVVELNSLGVNCPKH